MGTILNFPIDLCRKGGSVTPGHHCLVIPFPRLGCPHSARGAGSQSKKSTSNKAALIRKVKIAQKQMGMDDPAYRAMLREQFGVESSTELNEWKLVWVISHFRALGWKDRPARKKDTHGKPKTMASAKNPTTPVLKRMELTLKELGDARGEHVSWDYAASILKGLTGLSRLETATVLELQKVMVLLQAEMAETAQYAE